ncbi:MAG: ABC transporter permease subunit, partial [Acidimicrobiales bacterium]
MAVAEAFVPSRPRRGTARWSGLPKALRRITVADKVGLVLLAVLVVAAVFAPLIAPYNPIVPSGIPFTPPLTGGHLMGTDEVGFDIFSRVLFGLRTSLVGVVLVVTSGVVIGGSIGLVAGVVGGWVDTVLMRVTDLFLALPGPVLAIAFVAALGPSEFHTLLAVAIVWWPFYARIMRGEIRS